LQFPNNKSKEIEPVIFLEGKVSRASQHGVLPCFLKPSSIDHSSYGGEPFYIEALPPQPKSFAITTLLAFQLLLESWTPNPPPNKSTD
jgi:hypothetical protein